MGSMEHWWRMVLFPAITAGQDCTGDTDSPPLIAGLAAVMTNHRLFAALCIGPTCPRATHRVTSEKSV
ncbi:hypothetical protein RRG08_052797 [Elysia crispata]|uniref:Uncharacterized protein n=1 Tax=Elysia crispata TaxID=231223 RepID=A0AAE1EAH0_9GAST|nr:hypothetical protein RRG08_052797 [Elysia crispata]